MTPLTDTLCLQCGLCCNGVLFADVRPERGDNSPLFKQHGPRVAQPCPALNTGDCKCALYTERPARCRKFECKQLIAVSAGKISAAAALKQIRTAKKLAAQVTKLLSELGDSDTSQPLSKRFQRLQSTAERGGLQPEQFDTLADLQLTVHQLTLLLAQEFYA
jgi:hypothetical protein